jgi:hypothetical protein
MSLDRLTPIEGDEKEKIVKKFMKYLTSYGNYNEMPEPYHEIGLNEFLHRSSIGGFEFQEHRQISFPEPDEYRISSYMHKVRILWGYDRGIAIVYPGHWTCGKDAFGYGIIYPNPVRFFHIGCDHEYHELSQEECGKRGINHFGMCWHVYECPKCGMRHADDSSD